MEIILIIGKLHLYHDQFFIYTSDDGSKREFNL